MCICTFCIKTCMHCARLKKSLGCSKEMNLEIEEKLNIEILRDIVTVITVQLAVVYHRKI